MISYHLKYMIKKGYQYTEVFYFIYHRGKGLQKVLINVGKGSVQGDSIFSYLGNYTGPVGALL